MLLGLKKLSSPCVPKVLLSSCERPLMYGDPVSPSCCFASLSQAFSSVWHPSPLDELPLSLLPRYPHCLKAQLTCATSRPDPLPH